MKKILPVLLLTAVLLCACGNRAAEETSALAPAEESPEIVIVSTPPETEAPETEAYEEAAEPSPSPTVSPSPEAEVKQENALTITKHPGDENEIQEYSDCWFKATADNADSITWEFLDTGGNVLSCDELKAKFSGLEIELMDDGEWIHISGIPMDMNGYRIRTVFTGGGQSLTSKTANIGVVEISDFYEYYESVAENYLNLSRGSGADTYDLATDIDTAGVSFGYMLKDLDSDGIEEFIVGRTDSTGSTDWDYIIYSVFTLKAGKPNVILKSSSRNRYYLTSSGFLNIGSSGASESTMYMTKYSSGALSVSQGIYTAGSGDEIIYCYVTGGNKDSGFSEKISEEQFNALYEGYYGEITSPRLNTIN